MSKIKKAERLMLKNSLLEIEINPENGSILGIKDKRVENQYIKHKKFARLFRLMLPSTYWDGQHADSWDQKTSKIEMNKCASCGKYADYMCELCKSVYYCSQKCQHFHWFKG